MKSNDVLSVFRHYGDDFKPEKTFLAVFDIDETLINTKSMFSFLQYFLKIKFGVSQGEVNYQLKIKEIKEMQKNSSRETINRHYYRYFQSEKVDDLAQYAIGWFKEAMQAEDFFLYNSGKLLTSLRSFGAQVVFLSGSADFIVRPIVEALGGGDIIAVALKQTGGVASGEIAGIQTIGEGKRHALEHYLQQNNMSMDQSWACGDHLSDLPFIEMAAFPCVVAGCEEMEKVALCNNWPILSNDLSMEIAF